MNTSTTQSASVTGLTLEANDYSIVTFKQQVSVFNGSGVALAVDLKPQSSTNFSIADGSFVIPPNSFVSLLVQGDISPSATAGRNVWVTLKSVEANMPISASASYPVSGYSLTVIVPVTAPTQQTCTSFTYSDWGTCRSNSNQTRNVISSNPSGCTGGNPTVSRYCSYVVPILTCTSFTYSDWSACQSNNTQHRSVTNSMPSGCTGGTSITTQSCNYSPSNYSSCDSTAKAVVDSVGGCSNIDQSLYANIYKVCCAPVVVTKESLLSMLNADLADGVISDIERTALLTALNSYLK